MKKITFNRARDKVAIIAPSSGYLDAKEKLLPAGIELLKTKGFECIYHKNILSGDELPYFASSHAQRAREIKTALLDPQIKIIWAFRGGYGASEIALDFIDFDASEVGNKILIGFSDITALHLLFHQQFKMQVIHGAVVTSLLGHQANMLEPIISVLSGSDMQFTLAPINKENTRSIDGIICGGNLAVVCHMIGSKLTPQLDGKIVFLEDVNEKGYSVHRYLMQMKNAGLFSKIKALILGDFGKSDDNLEPSLVSFCRKYLQVPAFRAEGIGHLADNFPITIGAKATIKNSVLTVKSPFELI